MVVGPIIKFTAIGAAIAVVVLFLVRSGQVGIGNAAAEVGTGIQTFGAGGGSALSNFGKGIHDLGSGIGTGVSKLFNPLFTLKSLIYGETATAAATTAAASGSPALNMATVAATNTNTPGPAATTPKTGNASAGFVSLSSRVASALGSKGKSPSGATLTRIGPGKVKVDTRTASISHLSPKAQSKISAARKKAAARKGGKL